MAIHPTAVIDPNAEVDSSVTIGPYTVIDRHVRVASGCTIAPHVYLTGWTTLHEDCRIHYGAVVGDEPQDAKYDGSRSFCEIGPGCVVREYVTIHRGTEPESTTQIGARSFLLSGCHVAHNCVVGDDVTIINDAVLAGHVSVGDKTVIGGQAGLHQFVRVGGLVMVAGRATVAQDIPPFAMTDRVGHVAGLNRVGMRRAELPREDIADVREAYKRLYGAGESQRIALDAIADGVTTAAGRLLAEFVAQPSKRGIAGRARGTDRARD